MRNGVRLGIDVGSVRIGVASCDPSGLLATPLETVFRGAGDLKRLAALVDAHGPVEVVLGLPMSLRGTEEHAAKAAREFAAELARAIDPCPVRLIDERMTTVIAAREMRESGVSSRKGRPAIDQAAASVILQSALDAERTGGMPPGEVVRF